MIGKADREVGEAPHLAEELLGIPEPRQVLLVASEELLSARHRLLGIYSGVTYAAVMPPSTVNVAPLT